MVQRNSLNFNFKKKLGYLDNGELTSYHRPKSSALVVPTTEITNAIRYHVRPTCNENLTQFLLNTTFHGLKFVGNQSISYCERFIFLASFFIAFAIALYFIFDVYNKWDKSPVIVGISPFAISISEMPFPAITICNVNQVLKSKVEVLLNDTVKSSLVLELCNKENDIDMKKLSTMNLSNSVKDFEDFIVKASQPCSTLIISCVFAGVKHNCSEIFLPTITDEGLCCTFNKLHSEFFYLNTDSFRLSNTFAQEDALPVSWTTSSGYAKKLPKKFYPRPGVGIGVSSGLSVILDANIKDYFCSSTHGAGFKIAIHSPSEMPNAKETGMLIGAGAEARIRIDAKITEATDAVRSIQQKYRQCVFEEESELLSYAVYSKKNCNLECDAKRLYRKCRCVNYYMPRLYSNTSICGLKDISCSANITVVNIEPNDSIDKEYIRCNEKCLPGCFDYSYKGDIFVSPVVPGQFKLKNKFIEDMDPDFVRTSITILNFFYSENAFHPDRKDQFIGMTEFLSYTGGLMGLFLGFSSISIIEILYFCSFRPYCASYRYRKELKSIQLLEVKRQESQKDIYQNGNRESMVAFYDQFKVTKLNNKINYK